MAGDDPDRFAGSSGEAPAGIRAVDVGEPAVERDWTGDPPDLAARWRRPDDPPSLLRLRPPPGNKLGLELEHPSLLSKRVEVGKAPVRVTLERGSVLTLVVPRSWFGSPPSGLLDAELVSRAEPPERIHRLIQVPLPKDATGDKVSVPWPRGLRPGGYTLRAVATGTPSARGRKEPAERSLTVEGVEPVTVDLSAEKR